MRLLAATILALSTFASGPAFPQAAAAPATNEAARPAGSLVHLQPDPGDDLKPYVVDPAVRTCGARISARVRS